MKKEDIFSAMGNIDEAYLKESETAPKLEIKAGLGIGKTLAVAAALILMFGAALVLPKIARGNIIDPAGTVITDELSPSIDMAIRAHFDLDGDDEITTEMLNSITSLKIYRQDIPALSGTEYSLVRFEINGDNNFAAALPELMKPNYYEYVVGAIRGSGLYEEYIREGAPVEMPIDYIYQAYYTLYGGFSEDVYALDPRATNREVYLLYGILADSGMLDAWKISGNEFDVSSLKHFENLKEVEFVGLTPARDALSENVNVTLKDANAIDASGHPSYFDGVFLSPDGKYAIKISVANYASTVVSDSHTDATYELLLVDAADGSVITASGDEYVMEAALVNWSPDSKYAAIEVNRWNSSTNIVLFDTTNGSYRTLYGKSELETFTRRLFSYTDPTGTVWDNVHCRFDEWGIDSVKIELSLSTDIGGRLPFGSYVYIIPTQMASKLEYDLDLDVLWEQSFGPSEDDGIEIIEVDGVKIPVPAAYFSETQTIEFYAENNENGLLATVIHAEERNNNSGGTIFRIYRLTREQYEEISGENPGGVYALATDGEYYYTMSIPTSIEGDPLSTGPDSFMYISGKCQELVRERFAELNGFAEITTPDLYPQIDAISIVEVDGIKIPIYNNHESYSDIGYDTDGDYLFILYNKPQYESAGGGNQYLFSIYKYTKDEYLYKFASDAEFGVPPAVNDFRSRASVVAVDGDYYYVMLIGDVPPTKTLYSEAVVEHFAELNGFEKLTDENNVLEEMFTYDSEHKYYQYYPDGIETDYFYMIVLSQPVKQGEGGIWCVDRYFSMQTSGTPLVDTAGRPTIGWKIHLPVLPFDGEYTDFDAYYASQQQEYDNGNPDYELLGNPASLINRWCEATFGEGFNPSNNLVQVDYLANGIYDY